MFKSKIENRHKFITDVDAYIRDHEQVSLEDRRIKLLEEKGRITSCSNLNKTSIPLVGTTENVGWNQLM